MFFSELMLTYVASKVTRANLQLTTYNLQHITSNLKHGSMFFLTLSV